MMALVGARRGLHGPAIKFAFAAGLTFPQLVFGESLVGEKCTPVPPGHESNHVTSSYTRFRPGTKKPVVMTGWDREPGDRRGAQLFWVARKARTFSACFAVTPVSL